VSVSTMMYLAFVCSYVSFVYVHMSLLYVTRSLLCVDRVSLCACVYHDVPRVRMCVCTHVHVKMREKTQIDVFSHTRKSLLWIFCVFS